MTQRKPAQADDPFEMHAQVLDGDPFLMVEHIIEEFAQMGWNAQQLARLFQDPFYQATYRIGVSLGVDAVLSRIDSVLCRRGVIRVSTSERKANE